MEELTKDEIAAIFTAAGDSVTEIGTAKAEDETTDEFKDRIKRNVEHLEIIKAYKKLDETTSIWTSESFTAIDKAIVNGKKLYKSNMTKPSTETLKQNLQNLLNKYNEALQIQAQCKEQIIAVQAVIQDREDGNTNDSNSTDSEN